MRRMYVPAAQLARTPVALGRDEHKYLARVLRMEPGDPLVLFDGEGHEIDARIARFGRAEVELELVGERRRVPGPPVAITLLQALPRGERMDLVVQKTTELGVARIVPVLTARAVPRLDEATARHKAERLQTIAVEAARQCGRADVPAVAPPTALRDAFAAVRAERRYFVWEGSRGRALRAEPAGPEVALLIGPEGGFAEDEVALATQAGFVPVSLGPRILRTETAAIVAVALVMATAGGLDA